VCREHGVLREKILDAMKEHGGLTLATLDSLKKADSFIKEFHRMNMPVLDKDFRTLV